MESSLASRYLWFALIIPFASFVSNHKQVEINCKSSGSFQSGHVFVARLKFSHVLYLKEIFVYYVGVPKA